MIFHQKAESLYRARLFCRFDDRGLIYYFSHKDFPGMEAVPHSFSSSAGHKLQGWFYSYPHCDEERLVIFEHGLGGGHRSYLQEIHRLCQEGYRVFSYDHSGCMESGGENIGGLSRSLRDLDDCLKALKADPKVNTSHLSVVGHSWGGFSTLNICAFHPEVERLVVFSGLVSVEQLTKQYLPGLLRLYRKDIFRLEQASNPDHAHCNGAESLKHFTGKGLIVHSADDRVVKKSLHFDVLRKALAGKENISFLLVDGKGHNPNYTYDAAKYLATLSPALQKAKSLKTDEEKRAFRDSFDWDRMTAQDEEVWQEVFRVLR